MLQNAHIPLPSIACACTLGMVWEFHFFLYLAFAFPDFAPCTTSPLTN